LEVGGVRPEAEQKVQVEVKAEGKNVGGLRPRRLEG